MPSFRRSGPVYEPAAPDEDNCAWITLSQEKTCTTAVTTIRYGDKTARGISRETIAPGLDPYEAERLRQKAVKLSFFKAAREITGVTPSWGALTGIRPGKLAGRMLEEGKSPREVDRVLRDTYYASPERRRFLPSRRRRRACAPSARSRRMRSRSISGSCSVPRAARTAASCRRRWKRRSALMDPYLDVLCREITDAARMVRETGLRVKSFLHGRRHTDDALSPADDIC